MLLNDENTIPVDKLLTLITDLVHILSVHSILTENKEILCVDIHESAMVKYIMFYVVIIGLTKTFSDL